MKVIKQKGGESQSSLPEDRLVSQARQSNKLERSPTKRQSRHLERRQLVQSNSGKINRGTGIPGQGDGGPSKQKKIP